MNSASRALQRYVCSAEDARYLGSLAQLVIALVAAWYVARRVLAGSGAGAALRIPAGGS